MQYVEEFGIYFLAYLENKPDISNIIIKKKPKDVRDETFYKLSNGEHEEFAKQNSYTNYEELLKDVFKVPNSSSSPELVSITIKNLKKVLEDISRFFIFYSDVYNAIKHGFRIFIEKELFKIKSEKTYIISSDGEDYFHSICKKTNGTKYELIYPINGLIQNSLKILEDTNEIFNYLRKTNKYTKSSFFEYESSNDFLIHTKAFTESHTIYLSQSKDLEEMGSKFSVDNAKMVLKDNIITFYFNGKNSLEYPFKLILGPDYGDHPSPGIKSDLKISSSQEIDIFQYYNLIKVKDLCVNPPKEFKVILIDKKTGKKSGKTRYGNITPPNIKIVLNRDILNLLLLLRKITQEIIPVPLFLSKAQEKILSSTIKHHKWTQKEAKKILNDLKKNKGDIALVFIKRFDSKDIGLKNQFIGSTKNLDLFGFTVFNENSQKTEKFNIKNLVNKDCKINGVLMNPNSFIKGLKSSMNNNHIDPKNETTSPSDKFDMKVDVNLNQKYWYNEYKLIISIYECKTKDLLLKK